MTLRSFLCALGAALCLSSCGGGSTDPVFVAPTPVLHQLRGSLSATSGEFADFALAGTQLFIAAGFDGVRIVDVSDLDNPRPLGEISPYTSDPQSADNLRAIATDGNLAVVALYPGCSGFCMPGNGELRIYDVATPASPRLLASVPGGATALALQGSRLIALGNPDLFGQSPLRVIELQTPAVPLELSTTAVARANRLTLAGNRIYLGFAERDGSSAGVEALELAPSGLVTLLARDGSSPADPGINSVVSAFGALYSASGTPQLRIYETASLGSTAPQQIALAQAARELALSGRRLYVSQEGEGVAIYGLAAPLAPIFEGSIVVDGRAIGVRSFATFGLVRLAEERDGGSVGTLLRPERIRFFSIPD